MYELTTYITVLTLAEVKELESQGWSMFGNEVINNPKHGYLMELKYLCNTLPKKNSN